MVHGPTSGTPSGYQPLGSVENKPDVATGVVKGVLAASSAAQTTATKPLSAKATPSRDWGSVELPDAKLDELKTNFPKLAKTVNESKRLEQDRTLQLDGVEPVTLSNGKTLHPVEVAALKFYTRDGFRLLNGVMNYEKGVMDFAKNREISRDQLPQVKEVGHTLAEVLASAVNKLPETPEQTLYRGDTIPEDRVGEYKEGNVITQMKFSSLSASESKAGTFATTNSRERGGIPTLYIIDNPKKAKDIDSFSQISGEKERLTVPGQSWEITRVEDEVVYDLEQLDDEELIEEARAKGELIEKVVVKNGKEKIKYFTEDKDSAERVLRIYMKEV